MAIKISTAQSPLIKSEKFKEAVICIFCQDLKRKSSQIVIEVSPKAITNTVSRFGCILLVVSCSSTDDAAFDSNLKSCSVSACLPVCGAYAPFPVCFIMNSVFTEYSGN